MSALLESHHLPGWQASSSLTDSCSWSWDSRFAQLLRGALNPRTTTLAEACAGGMVCCRLASAEVSLRSIQSKMFCVRLPMAWLTGAIPSGQPSFLGAREWITHSVEQHRHAMVQARETGFSFQSHWLPPTVTDIFSGAAAFSSRRELTGTSGASWSSPGPEHTQSLSSSHGSGDS